MAVSGSPESDLGSFECFQNYTAPEVFVQGLAGQINQQDVEAIIRAQKQMLQRFEKTNEMLSNCNALSNSRFALAQKELKKHTTLLHDMRKDLDNVFKRIRNLKTKLAVQYPAAYADAQNSMLKEEDDEEEEEATSDNDCKNKQVKDILRESLPSDRKEEIKRPTITKNENSSSCESMSSGKISSTSSSDN
ncbi:UNVERIFIED_CONTAM: hypothetical protein RMT77_007217 [Armadillidium vulgare]